MATKLKKELRKKKNESINEAKALGEIINQSNQLLLDSYKEDEETKRALQIHSNVRYEEEITESVNRLKIHDDIYKQESFTGQQVKDLCNKYDLRILPISEYTGKVPPELYRKVREFAENNKDQKVIVSDSNFFILAPVEMFKTRKVRKILDKDPILFYKAPVGYTNSRRVEENDVLINVYDWGNDFSFFRTLRYLFNPYREFSNDGWSNKMRTIAFSIPILLITLANLFLGLGFVAATILNSITLIIYFIGMQTEDKIDDLWNQDIV